MRIIRVQQFEQALMNACTDNGRIEGTSYMYTIRKNPTNSHSFRVLWRTSWKMEEKDKDEYNNVPTLYVREVW